MMFLHLQGAWLIVLLGLMPVKESFCTFCSVPEFRVRSNEKGYFYANETSDIKLPCYIKTDGSGKEYTSYWEKDNKTFKPANRNRMSVRLYRWLKIKKVRKDDAGLYTCVVMNKCGGKNSVSMRLYVRELPTPYSNRNITPAAPRFTVPTRKLQKTLLALPVGNTAKLDCSAEGYPSPSVVWYKNGKLFNERRGSPLYSNRKYVLALKDVVPSDTGRYSCNVSNRLGWINHSYYIDVHEIIRAKPVILPLSNATVFVGGNATLLCKVFSDSMPHFQWLRWLSLHSNSSSYSKEFDRSHGIQYSSSNSKHEFRHGISLTLVNVTKEDEGRYTCIVGNAYGFSVGDAYVTVHEKIEEIHNVDGNNSTALATTPSLRDWPKANNQKTEKPPEEEKRWIDGIRYPWLLFGFLAGVIVIVITVSAWFCWKLRKIRSSSIKSPPLLASLRPRYDERNEYVVVLDSK